jgi:hypothetical protein
VARAGKAHTSEDIWHLSIDDLLAAPKEPARLAARGPFVINLSTSTASIGPPPKGLRSFDSLHLYQLRRGPEDQAQFLLRLGIIATEVEADAILSGMLEHYPGATKDSAEDDDRAAVAAKARPAEPPKPAQPPAKKPPEARRPPPNAAPPTPPVAAKPQEPVRWDIDELLPDLPVTRPSLRERKAVKDSPPVVRPPVTDAPRAKAPATEQAPADRDRLVAAASRAPGNLPAVREPPASREPPPARRESAMQHEPLAPRETRAPRESAALRETPAVRESPTQTKSESLAAEATPSTEIEFSAPAPPAAVPARGVVEALDYDPNAITHEVEIATFIFEALEIEAPTVATPKVDVPVFLPATQAPLDEVPVVAVAPTGTDEAHATNAVDAPASIAAASAPEPDADSGTLEQLVAKIGALVESADAHDKDAISPQNPASAVRPPTPSAKPAWPIAASAIVRPAERPSPPPRVHAVQPAPADAPSIDSTQTIRALTPLELADDQASQWFSIQLALSEENVDPEHVPSLDIFNEYRLYSVTGLDHDRVMHALRLGFFSSELAAEAVAGYLRGFFDSPCIKRVSLAERERFAEKGVIARKDIGATGVHAVIELAGPALLPERRTQVSDSGKRRAPRSIWSRLVAPLKR